MDLVLLFFVSGIPLAEKPTGKKYYLMTHGSRPLEGVDKWAEYKVSAFLTFRCQ